MNKDLAIAIIGSNDRWREFQTLIESLDFDYPYFIHLDNPTDKYKEVIFDSIIAQNSFRNIEFTESQIGLSNSINRIWDLTKDYEYTLFLEEDWQYVYHMKFKDAINDLVAFMDAVTHIDHIILRKWSNHKEMSSYFWNHRVHSHVTKYPNDHIEYPLHPFAFFRSHPLYTNNPHIRRNARYKIHNILPVESNYEDKSHNWGHAEFHGETMSHRADLHTWWIRGGLFVHQPDYSKSSFFPCPNNSGNKNSCKFDVIEPHSLYCSNCPGYEEVTYFDFWKVHDRVWKQ